VSGLGEVDEAFRVLKCGVSFSRETFYLTWLCCSDTYVTYTRPMLKKFWWTNSRTVYTRVRGFFDHV